LVETANMIEPKLHDGASAVVSICPYKKLNKVFFFTSKSEIVITIFPCGKMNNSFFLETNKSDLAQKVY
jgi:hypothetical protein